MIIDLTATPQVKNFSFLSFLRNDFTKTAEDIRTALNYAVSERVTSAESAEMLLDYASENGQCCQTQSELAEFHT